MKPKFFLSKSIATLLATGITLTSMLHALPQGEQVQAGSAAFSRAGAALDIHTSDRAIINYQSFSIGSGERVNFIQPSAMSMTLNRVTAPNPSQIFGTLQSNGKIVLANPYGIFFESGSIVNVGGLIAGAGHISDSDFLAGRINFSSLTGDVENRGSIIAINDVGLYGAHVSNEGVITSQKGSVTLAAGSSVYVGEKDGNIFVGTAADIPKAKVVSKPGVKNSGTITAPQATLVAGDMYGMAIAQSGTIISGNITIAAGKGGTVDVSGRLDASNRTAGKSGGKIKIKGDAITVRDATLDVSGEAGGGTVVIDAGHDATTPTSISSSATITARGEGAGAKGGTVQILGDNVSILAAGVVDVSGVGGGGNVTLDGGHDATTPTTVTSSGTILALGTGAGAKGGTVQMLGDHVGLFDKAVVDVSGDAGGGTVLIGGDYQGKNPDIHNAARTYISLDAQIRADAISSGNGGKVIVWSDETTRFLGNISARGGTSGGDGGFAEVSGKKNLFFNGLADLGALTGKAGTLLLDPLSIQVINAGTKLNLVGAAGNDGNANIYAFTEDPALAATIDADVITGILNGGTSVTLQAINTIVIDEAITAGAGSNGQGLSLQSGGDTTVNQTITLRGGTIAITTHTGTTPQNGSIILNALLDTTGAGQTGGAVTLSVNGGAGNVQMGANITTNDGAITVTAPITLTAAAVSLNTNATTAAGDITLGAVTAGVNSLTVQTGAVAGADVNGTIFTGGAGSALNLQTIGGTASFTGAVSATALNVPATVVNVSSTGTGGTITNAVAFANTGTLTLGQAGGTQTYTGGLDTSGVGGLVTLNGTVNTTNTVLRTGAITLGSNTVLNSNATSGVGDIAIGAVTGGGFGLTLQTGAVAGADVDGTSVSGVGTLQLQTIGGTASFTGAVSATALNVPATVVNVSSTGTGGTITNAVAFANTGTLTLGQAGGTQTYTGGLDTSGVGGLVTLNGTVNTTNTVLRTGAITLGSNTVLNSNATSGVGDIAIGAVTGGGFNLTLQTGAVAGADVNGTSVSGVGTLQLQTIGGTASFTGAVSATALNVPATVVNVSSTGTGGTITNAVAFANTGALTLGQAGGTQTYTGGVDTSGVGGLVTLNGTVNTTNTVLRTGAITLGSNTVLNSNATSGVGDIAIGAVTGGGFGLTLQTGAVAGADVDGTSVSGVGTLQLQTIGGTASFTGAVSATALNVPATVVNVSSTGTGGTITNAVAFANTGTLTLGQAGGTQTYTGGLDTSGVGGLVTLNGTVNTTNTVLRTGAITLGSNTVLNSNATSGVGDIAIGAVTGGGFGLTLQTGAVAGADVDGTSVSGVGTLQLQTIGGTASFTGAVSATALNVPATVVNVSSTGTGGTITNAVAFANTGTLTLGQAGGTQTYTGGLDTSGVGGLVTLNGTVNTTNTVLRTGAITLGSNTVLNSNATSGVGDIAIGAVTGGGFNLTLQTGAVAGADVNGTSVSGVGTLQLQTIGGTASFTGAVSATALNVPATVVNVSSTGTGGTITNAVAFANTGALTLGQAGGTQTYTGGVDTSGVGGLVTLNGTVNTTNTVLRTGAITLGSNTVLNSNATSGVGDIAIGAVTGGGFGLTLQTGAVAGADVDGTSVSGVGTLQLQTIGGTASFTGAVSATALNVPATVVNVSSTGTGGTITNAVAFANTGTLTLGQAGGTQTYTGGLVATLPTSKSIAGTINSAGVAVIDLGTTAVNVTASATLGGASTGQITLGNATLADGVTLILGTTGANRPITTGTITGTNGGTAEILTISTAGAIITTGAIGNGVAGNISTVSMHGATAASAATSITTGGNITVAGAGGGITLRAIALDVSGDTISSAADNTPITFITDTLTSVGAAVNAGTGTFQIAPSTITNTVDVRNGAGGAAASNYNLAAMGVTAGSFIIGSAQQTGNITLATGNILNANFDLTVLQNVAGAGSIILAGDYTAGALGVNNKNLTLTSGIGGIALNGAVITLGTGIFTANGNSTLGANLTVTATGGINFTGTLDADAAGSNRALVVTAGAATATFSGNVGATQALADFDVTAGLTVFNAAAAQSVNVTAQGANTATLTGPVRLDQNLTIDASGATANNVTFTSTIDADAAASNRTLTVTAGARTVTFTGNVGATQALADFDVTAGLTVFNAAAAQTVNVTAQGANTATLAGPVRLDQNLTIDASGATANNVTFTGAINADAAASNRTLTVTSGARTATFGGNIGATQALADFDVTAGLTVFNAAAAQSVNVTAQGGNTATLTGPVRLDQNVTFDTSGATANNVTFTSTINADAAGSNRALVVTAGAATATFSGNVGATQALADFDVTAGLTVFNAAAAQSVNVTAQGANTATLTGPVRLDQNLTIDASGATANNVTFTSTIDADAAASNRTLTVTAGARTVTFTGNVGATQALADFDVTAGLTVFNAAAAQSVNVTAQGGNTATLAGPVRLDQNLTIDASGATANNVTFTGAINADAAASNRTLTVTSGARTATFGGNIGATQALADFDVTAGLTVFNAAAAQSVNVTAQGGNTATLTGPVRLDQNVTFDTSGATANNLTFTSTINADAAASNRTLVVTAGAATATFSGNVGATQALADFDVTAGLTVFNAAAAQSVNVTAQGANTATLTGPVRLDQNLTIDASGATANNVTFTSTIDADAAASNRTLTVTAGARTVTFTGNVGATQALADFDVTAGLTVFNAAAAQSVNVTAQGGNTATLAGPVRLDQNLTIDASGATANNVTFTGAINADAAASNRTLTVTSGARTATFGGNIGATQALADFDVTAGLTVFNAAAAQSVNVTAQGGNTATLTGPVRLDQNVTFDTSGATANNVTFTSTINADAAGSNRALVVTAGAATATFSGNVGATQALADFDVTAGLMVFNAAAAQTVNVTAQGGNTATLTGPVRLDQNVTFDTSGATANNVTFTGAINADAAASNRTLTVTSGARTATFGGNIGATQALADFDVTAGLTVFNAAAAQSVNVTAQGGNTATLTGPVRLDQNVTFDTSGATANNVTFTSTIDADAAANNRTLAVTAGVRTVTFTGNVGATQALADFDVTAGLTVFNAAAAQSVNVTAQGANTATLTGPVRLDQNLTIDASGATANNLTFTSTIDADAAASNRTLTVTAGARTVTFTGNVGATQALADFDVTAGLTVFNAAAAQSVNVTAQGANTATLTGPVRLDQNLTIDASGATANNVTFTSTIDADAAANNRRLAVTAGVRTVTFTGNVGATQALADFDVTAGLTVFNAAAAQTVNVTAQGGNTATLSGAVRLDQNLTVNTGGATANNLTFTSPINADAAASNRTLAVTAGARTVTFTGNVGATQALADFDVTAGLTVFNAAAAQTVNVTAQGANTATLTGAVRLDQNVTFDTSGATANNLTFTSTIDADAAASNRTLTVTSGARAATFGGNIGAGQALADFDVTAAVIVFNAAAAQTVNVTAQGANTATLTGAVTLSQDLTIDTSGATANNLTFSGAGSTIDGLRNLTITSGSRDVLAQGTIGGTTALTSLTVNGAAGAGTITLANIGGAAAGVTGATVVGNAASGSVTFTGTTYNANPQTYTAAAGDNLRMNAGAATTFTSTNDAIAFNTGNILLANGSDLVVNSAGGAITALAINGNSSEDVTLNANGGATNTVVVGAIGTGVANGVNTVVLTGSGGVTLNGSITTDNTAGNSVTVTGPATLGATLTINTSGNTGGITFSGATSTINGGQALTLAAGAGNVLLGGAVGGGIPLGAILVSSANNVTANAAITAASLVQSAGTGTTTLNGPVNTSTGTGVQLTTNTIAQNSTITTTSGGLVTFTNAGQLTISGDIASDGAVTQNGAGATLFGGGGTRAITTTNDAVAFLTAVTLAAPVAITSGAGNVTFSSTVNGPASLSASSSGVTTFTGVVGGSSPLASLTTNGGGTTVVPGAVITAGSQNFSDVLVLAADTLLASTGGGAINLLSVVSGGNRILQLSTAGSATLGASLLNLTRLIPGVAGVTTLGTAGTTTTISLPTPLTFTGPVSVAGNVLIETIRGGASSQGTNSGDELRFNQAVTGSGSLNATAGGVLTFAGGTSVGALSASAPIINLNNTSTTGNLIADAKPAASTDGSDGLLNLTGGSYSSSFGNVFFNPMARTSISKHATILSLAGNLAISAAGAFFMGNEQKLLVNNGALNIVANTATLGDMAAFTRMNVTAGSVQLQGRSLNGFFNANRKDGGLGFVSPTITFSTGSMAFVSGTNQKAVFSTRDAIASVPQISGVSLQIDKDIAKQFGNLDLKVDSFSLLPVIPNISFGTVQPIASGTFVVDPSQTRVVFIFEIPKLVELPQDTFLSKAIRKVLNSMGINEREATSDENITVSLRRGVFSQPIEGKAEMEDLDFEVVLNRLTKEEILYIVGSYLKLAGDDFAKLTEISISLSEQVGKFHTANPEVLGLDGFTKWLQTQRATDKAADQLALSLDKLSAVFVELSRVGLTKKEITLCKVQICNKLKEFMPDMAVRDVIPLVEGGGPPAPEAPRPAVTTPPADAPPATPPPLPAGQAPSPDSTQPGNPAAGAGAPPVANPAPPAPAPDASVPPKAQ